MEICICPQEIAYLRMPESPGGAASVRSRPHGGSRRLPSEQGVAHRLRACATDRLVPMVVEPDLAAPPTVDKRPEAIRAMFNRIAPAYDLLNHLLSASLDHVWRRRSARALTTPDGPAADLPALDLCCGTGDQAVALHKRGARVAAADFSLSMVALAKRKFRKLRLDGDNGAGSATRGSGTRSSDTGAAAPSPNTRATSHPTPRPEPLVADALVLPFPTAAFRAATVSFGLRNVVDLDAALAELARVVVPGGQLLVLEFALPRFPPLRAAYLFYFRRLLPWIGRRISGDSSAYSYLPTSVLEFPQRQQFVDRMTAAGFTGGAWEDLAAGIVCLYSGRKTA
jgi:demethylmenaquinone methyltransferase/2-methoxy-6-polyprenyl-1,4-benzoquinol methylase